MTDDTTTNPLTRWRRAYELGAEHDLSGIERAVLVRNAFHVDTSWESEATIAKVLGYSRQSVNAAHKSLRGRGAAGLRHQPRTDERLPGGVGTCQVT